VLRASVRYSITDYSANIITNLINAECEAATYQCNQGMSGSVFLFCLLVECACYE
jgi:hypothetical protein